MEFESGDQMPDGKHVLIGLPYRERDDLDLGEFALRFQTENDRHRRGIAGGGIPKTRTDGAAGAAKCG